MHELIYDLLLDRRAGSAPPALLRMPLDGGALVACFDTGRMEKRHCRPRWVAKTAYGEAACRRLRAEAQALGVLEPLSAYLAIPRLLGWRESADDGMACMAQSGLRGRRRPAPNLAAAAAWLERFQTLSLPSRLCTPRPTLAALGHTYTAAARLEANAHSRHAALLCPLLQHVEASTAEAASTEAVPIHGDFWAGNVLFDSTPWSRSAPPTGVLDWSGLAPGTALDDILTWVATATNRLDAWQQNFFTLGRRRNFLRVWAARAGYSPVLARWAFYLFQLRRLLWEFGLDLQARSPAECERARRFWTASLAWQASQGWPDPFLRDPSGS